MKWNYNVSHTVIAMFAIILPMSAFANDQDEKEQGKREEGGQRHEAKAAPQRESRAPASSGARANGENARNEARVNNGASAQSSNRHTATVRATSDPAAASESSRSSSRVQRTQQNQVTAGQTAVSPATSRSLQSSTRQGRSQQAQVSSNQAYNRGNNYGGLWSAGDTHSDWNRNGEHSWNNHNYRWYDGGWLIIDAGYTPYYAGGASTVSNVQMKLADQGYYRGPIDGDLGPGTRNAIANYQTDYNLSVTGHINDPLLQSLRLE